MIVNTKATTGAPAWLSSADNSAASSKTDTAATFAAMLRQNQWQSSMQANPQMALRNQAPIQTQTQPQTQPQPQAQAAAPAPQPVRQSAPRPAAELRPATDPAPAPTSQTQATQQTDESQTPEQTDQLGQARSANGKAKTRAADKPPASSSARAKPAADAASGADAAKPADVASANQPTAATAVDPALAQMLASLQLGRPPAASTGLSLAGKLGKDAAAGTDGQADESALGEDGRSLKSAPDLQARADPAKAGSDAGKADSPGASFAAALLDQQGTEAAAGAQPAAGDIQAPTALFGEIAPTSNNAAAGADSAATPASVNVPTPVDSPDFPQALGIQLSVLARDGIQHAELHLNPTDMGPVSVNIVMDGTQARIDFGADVAATRHAIESGLPELASALRDAGFTLTGGGVSQQASQQSSSGRGDGSSGDGSGRDRSRSVGGVSGGDSAEPVARASRRTVSAGGLDLYA